MLSRAVYASLRWRHVRRKALKRANYECERCGRVGRLEVHHKEPLAKGGAPYDLRNLEVLCRPCHFAETAEQNRRLPPDHPRRQLIDLARQRGKDLTT